MDIAFPFCLVKINPMVGGCAGGNVGEGAAGRRSRSSTYPRAFCFVGLARCAIAQALVLALLVIKAEPGADAGLGLGDTGIGVEVDLLVFEAAPQPLDEDVVHVAADRKSTRLNSSHSSISYAVFCLKKKKKKSKEWNLRH